ncbi:MAG: transposase [Bradymonadia bacterium]
MSYSAFGPRVHAFVTLLSGVYHVPRRRIQLLLADGFGLSVSLGAIMQMQRRVSLALAPGVDEAAQAMRQTTVPTGLDETGWRQAGERRWLWIAITELLTIITIRASRGGQVVTEMVGAQAGERRVMCDRWSGYSQVPLARRQFCWAHLLRDIQKMAEAKNARASRIGHALVCGTGMLFRWWRRFCAAQINRAELQTRIAPIQERMRMMFKAGTSCAHGKTRRTCRGLKKTEAAMWTFLRVDGVEPTNNASERAIRQAVIWRRISLGRQSDAGSRFVERILSVAGSLGQQGRSVFNFLQAAIGAKFARR